MLIKTCTDEIDYNAVILEWRRAKQEENVSKFLKSMNYKTVTSMRDCVMKRNFI